MQLCKPLNDGKPHQDWTEIAVACAVKLAPSSVDWAFVKMEAYL